jgi:hypothetical protein
MDKIKIKVCELVIQVIRFLSNLIVNTFNIKNYKIKLFTAINVSFILYLLICITIAIYLNLFFQLFLFLFIFIEIRRRFDELDDELNVKILEVEHDNFFNCTILSFLHVFNFLFLAYFFRNNILILILGSLLITFSTIEFYNLNLNFINGLMYRNFNLKEAVNIIKNYYDGKERDEKIKEILEDIYLEFPDLQKTFEDKFKYHKTNFKIMQQNNIARETIYKRVNKVLNIFILNYK